MKKSRLTETQIVSILKQADAGVSVKGELERDLRETGFSSLTLVRPGLIGGERGEFRLGERVAEVVLKAAGPVLPRKWRVNPARNIARAMLEAAVAGRAGERVVGSGELA